MSCSLITTPLMEGGKYSQSSSETNPKSSDAHWRLASALNNFGVELMYDEEEGKLEEAMRYLKDAIDIRTDAAQRASCGSQHQTDAVILRCKSLEQWSEGRQRQRKKVSDATIQRPPPLGLFALDPDAERGDDKEHGLSFSRRPLHIEPAQNSDNTGGSPSIIAAEQKRQATLTLYNISLAHERTDNLDLAESMLKLAIRMVPRSYDPALTSFLLNAIGHIHYRQGLNGNAVDDLDASFEIVRLTVGGCDRGHWHQHGPSRIDLEDNVATTLFLLGRIYYERGEHDHAQQLLAKLLRVHRKVHGDDHITVAVTLFNIGLVLRKKNDLVGSLEHFQHFLDHVMSARKQWQKADDGNGAGRSQAAPYGREIAIALHAKGLVLLDLDGSVPEAVTALSQSVRVSRLESDWDRNLDLAQTQFDLATVFHGQGQFVDALNHYNESLRIYCSVVGDNDDFVGAALCKIGEVHEELGEYDGALETFGKALDISRRLFGDRDEAVANMLSVIGNMYLRMGETATAMRYFSDSQRILSYTGAETPLVCLSPLQCSGIWLPSSAAAA